MSAGQVIRPARRRRGALATLLLLTMCLSTPAAAGSASGWRITPTAIPKALNGQLFGQSCVSATACTAVGATTTARGIVQPLAEQWTGTRWRIERPPMPPGAHLGQLFSVSCTSARSCTAVGRFVGASGVSRVLVERLSGSSWRVERGADPAGSPWSELNSVSCSSPSACLAVGDSQTASGPHLAFSERWDGRAWHLLTTPNLAGAGSAFLNGLACATAASCIAVGGSDATALAERWDGRRWRILTVPSPAGAQFAFLLAVSCRSAASCTAVGGSDHGNLAERWNGSAWHAGSVPGPAGVQFSYLAGVSCASSTACTAVGGYLNGAGRFLTQGATRTTRGWSAQATPNPAGTSGNILGAVTCFAASNCVAVGQANGDGTPVVLGARWNGGQWSRLAVPTANGAAETQLNGVSCPGIRQCLAVGASGPTAGRTSAVAARWDGAAWHPQHISGPPGANLQGIDCTSRGFCMAVGGTASGTLAERWTGARWTVLPTPTPAGSQNAGFGGVSCTSASFCMAAGGYCTAAKAICSTGNGPNSALTERWNGHRWMALPTPMPSGAVQTFLGGISCTSPTACTTTGETHSATGVVHTIAERWNGVRWEIEATPNPAGASFASLAGVACTSPSSCIAVGGSDTGNLSERWNGQTWRILPTPTPPGSQGLASVSCPAQNACTAAGWRFTLQGGYVLAERWNGSHWRVQPTPLFAGDQDMNAAVTCPTTSVCVAVGGQESPGPTAVPYAERWTAASRPRSPRTIANSVQPLGAPTKGKRSAGFTPTLLRLGEQAADPLQRRG